MATFTFESTIMEDGSLAVPIEVAAALGLRNGDTLQVQIDSTRKERNDPTATMLDRAVYEMSHRTPEQVAEAQTRAMDAYKPVRTVPAGKTLADIVSGKWPGDETDAQIDAALKELS